MNDVPAVGKVLENQRKQTAQVFFGHFHLPAATDEGAMSGPRTSMSSSLKVSLPISLPSPRYFF